MRPKMWKKASFKHLLHVFRLFFVFLFSTSYLLFAYIDHLQIEYVQIKSIYILYLVLLRLTSLHLNLHLNIFCFGDLL